MDNLSEYLPLIVIIGSIVYSMIRGATRRNQDDEQAASQAPTKKVKETQSTVKETYRSEKMTREALVRPKMEREDMTISSSERTHRSHIQQHVVAESSLAVEEIEEEELPQVAPIVDLSNPDEVKKAIIYAEIFNRKE